MISAVLFSAPDVVKQELEREKKGLERRSSLTYVRILTYADALQGEDLPLASLSNHTFTRKK